MIGNNYNKKRAQTLILIILILATIISTILGLSFSANIENQLTKMEEENQKTLSVAQAGVEAALKKNKVIIGTDILPESEFTGEAISYNNYIDSFITPLINKDEQYTFYLSLPNITNNEFDFKNLISYYNNNPIVICSSSENSALEIAFIKEAGFISRIFINPPNNEIIKNGVFSSEGNNNCPSNIFKYYYLINNETVGDKNLLLIIRVLNEKTKIGLKSFNKNFPPQGKLIISKAISKFGVVKEIQFFQSYPQIPAEFFITSF